MTRSVQFSFALLLCTVSASAFAQSPSNADLAAKAGGVSFSALVKNAEQALEKKEAAAANASSNEVLPPDQTPAIPVNPEAPKPFLAMKKAYDDGDRELASQFADQYVRYMQRLLFEVRDLSQLIGEALVRNSIIDEEDWVGVGQYMNKEFALAKGDATKTLKATADVALDRVTPDPKQQAEIYVFCTLNSRWCREMGPDIERLWQVAKGDPNLKMGVFTLGAAPAEWLQPFREHTGMTMPIKDGAELAKSFRIGFVPAVVVRAPNGNMNYLRTGAMKFQRLYEFVRCVQGLPPFLNDQAMQVVKKPVGRVEIALASGKTVWDSSSAAKESGSASSSIERF